MSTSFISENTDHELSMEDLQGANGGVAMLILAALLPGPSVWEVFWTDSTLGKPDGTEPGTYKVAPDPEGKVVLIATCHVE